MRKKAGSLKRLGWRTLKYSRYYAHNEPRQLPQLTHWNFYTMPLRRKKPKDVAMHSNLLEKSRVLNINFSAALKKFLSQHIAEHARKQWVEQNRNAKLSYSEFVEVIGCFGDEYRTF